MLEVVGPYVLYIFSAKISYLRPPLLDDESSPTTQLNLLQQSRVDCFVLLLIPIFKTDYYQPL